jgi:helix-turn-helix protein
MRRPRTVPDGTPAPTPPPPQPRPPAGPGRFTDRFLTVLDVADLWSVDKDTVYAAIYAAELPYVDLRRPGGSRARIRIRESAAHQYMADRERSVRAA